ncbi:MAG: hypothetical protein ACREXY_04195 [Gammaproteobacteria bacterium]
MTRSVPLLAKRLLEPTWLSHPVYVQTLGPEVADVAALAGLAPDPEQQLLLDLTFALGADGKSAAFEIDVVAARQNLKTAFILQAELGWLFVTEERLIVHSAHELSTTEEAFIDLASLIEGTSSLSKRLAPTRGTRPGISEGNGRWGIKLATGARAKYKARLKDGGRGLTGNKVVLDEAFALTPSHMGALLPTLAAVPDPQVIKASSAGKVGSLVLKEARDRGRAGTSPRQVYVEWGDLSPGGCSAGDRCNHEKTIPGCALDDESRWERIMPALHRRVTLETIRAMRQSMPPEEFAREFMVWWDVEDDAPPPIFDLAEWARLARPSAKQPARAGVVVEVAPNRKTASIGVAADGKKGRTLVLTRTGEGTSWVVPTLEKMIGKRDIVEVALRPGSQAGVLIPALIAAGIEFESISATEAGQACAGFQSAVVNKTVEHVGQSELDAAVANARTRFSGDAEVFDQRDRSIDITPVVAAAEAAFRWAKRDVEYDVLDSIY